MSSAKWQPMRLNVMMDILFLDPCITKTPSDGSMFIKNGHHILRWGKITHSQISLWQTVIFDNDWSIPYFSKLKKKE